MVRLPVPPNPKLDALEEQRVDLATQISVLADKIIDKDTLSDLRRELLELERRIFAARAAITSRPRFVRSS